MEAQGMAMGTANDEDAQEQGQGPQGQQPKQCPKPKGGLLGGLKGVLKGGSGNGC
jgi:hypothetical protein